MGDVIAFRPKRLTGFIPGNLPPLLATGRDAGSIAEPRGLIEFAKRGTPPEPPKDCS